MKLSFSVFLRSSSFVIILLAHAALIVIFSLMIIHLEHDVNSNSENVVSQFKLEIENMARLIQPMNSSSTHLARFLSSTLTATTNISFSDIETKVAPLLFQAYKTVPYLAQISYIGMEGLFFSFYTNDQDHQSMAMYSNSSNWGASNAINKKYYVKHVYGDNGELYGDAAIINHEAFNINNASYWVGEAINNSNGHYASLGTKWNNGHDLLFITSARITRKGVVSIGFSAKAITDFFTSTVGKNGARLHLATKDGKVLVKGIKHNRLVISNDTVFFQSMNGVKDEGAVSCKDSVVASTLTIQGVDHLIHCSSIDIMGIESVYVLAVPQNGLVNSIIKCKRIGLILLVAVMVMILIAMLSFLFTNTKAEQKSVNKSRALAIASHDVRSMLSGLNGLIDMYLKEVPDSEFETKLKKMDSCSKDLLGVLDSILDASKIEAGKMQLQEEEFEVFQLLKDVVDSNGSVAMSKGVNIVLEPCNDGSVRRYSRAKGDRLKLKRVLCNLLNNAVKFTDEGQITVRARAEKLTPRHSVTAANRRSFSLSSRLLNRRDELERGDIEADNSGREDHGLVDFIFEVDDTGKGIPKDKYESVFENYVQVKETALDHSGTGLGLGIVKSLVRLMHGDIKIVDKDNGEKGTCFRFNVVLAVGDDITRKGNRSQALTIGAAACSGSSMSCSSSSVHEGGRKECGGRSSSAKPLSGKKVLVVEDNEVLRKIALRNVEEQLGASTERCENGEQAVQLVREGLSRDCLNPPYDYIIMDCEMPVMNGCEATRLIRKIEKPYGVHIPIIALTANSGEEAKKTLEAGMDDYLVKPINTERLLEAVRNIHSRE